MTPFVLTVMLVVFAPIHAVSAKPPAPAEGGKTLLCHHGKRISVPDPGAAAHLKHGDTRVLAVTVLTSLNQDDLQRVGVDHKVADQVVRLALLSKEAGMDGVVASPHEVSDIRATCGRSFIIVTPGIRPAEAGRNDQRRVMTPADAVRAGVDYIVVGRPIIEAADPVGAARAIVAEMAQGGR